MIHENLSVVLLAMLTPNFLFLVSCCVIVVTSYKLINSNGRAKRIEKSSDAKPWEKRVSEQYPCADSFLSIQNNRFSRGLKQKSTLGLIC
jgi:hypothetical protein